MDRVDQAGIYWVDQYLRQQWDRGIVDMEWRCVGVDVRSNCMVTCFVIKAITVQWWHKHLGVLGFITFVHVVSRCNIYQVVM
ncbi:hypothetical protein HID58_047049, partial [Brassica napus]